VAHNVRDGAIDLLESDHARLKAALSDDAFALVKFKNFRVTRV
jgi:hypothetical protein